MSGKSAEYGFYDKLHEHWDKVNMPYMNDALENIPSRTSEAGKSIFAPTRCMKLGLCVCGRNARGREAELFHSKLVAKMKVFFCKGSVPRQRLETNLVVLKLQQMQVEDHFAISSSPLYFSLGYINMKLWLFSIMQMVVDDRPVRRCGLVPLRLASEGESKGQIADVGLHMFARHLDMSHEITCKVYYLVRSKSRMGTAEIPMLPHHMEIEEAQAIDLFHWLGFDAEKPKPRPGRPRGPGHGPHPGPRPQQPKRRRSGETKPRQAKLKRNNDLAEAEGELSSDGGDLEELPVLDAPSSSAGQADVSMLEGGFVDGEYQWPMDPEYEPSYAESQASSDHFADVHLQEAAALLGDAEADTNLEAQTDKDVVEGEAQRSHEAMNIPVETSFASQREEVAMPTGTAEDMGPNEAEQGGNGNDRLGDDATMASDAAALAAEMSSDSESTNPSDVSVSSLSHLADASCGSDAGASDNASSSSELSTDQERAAGRGSEAADAALLNGEDEEEVVGRAPRATDIKPDDRFPYVHGDIRYNHRSQNLVSHCSFHSGNCRRTRTTKPGRKASQGRPMGELAAWLDDAPKYKNAKDHSSQCHPTHAERVAARAKVESMPNGKDFSECWERKKEDDEDCEPG